MNNIKHPAHSNTEVIPNTNTKIKEKEFISFQDKNDNIFLIIAKKKII